MKNSLLILILLFTADSFACSEILDSSLRVLDSDTEQSLCEYSGKVVLVVNVASKCGYTPQYAGLQRLYSKYKEDGLVVIGIPSRDFFFKQEFSEESKVAEFCSTEYGVDFPMFATAKVKGRKAHPLYKKLIAATGKEPSWNFNKYLIDRDGQVIGHYESSIKPESEDLVSAIQSIL
ncbi:MAG: glutathione peroxidase [SAR86 cluster bacterium BACL1 MAG-120920-bin57]|jgi:glutathione peroxidase|uniref:Glutathione peroxidase n=2 Tax=SAR86 cluster TaxID=62672 RepID=A0A0R2U3V0_9GAMM|nr:MAG: glutathione peroxidase [SAR86 cluster bacterium BACL1 MAG-120920-bin57]KRO94153.1 MAG: glutathione peroxidase [SAR86 cluster bacterium BACL1 MAG-120820-bin45]KRO97988.1 MAG: glutathione peroxidase [SAR86 cluster bacterium BACL1 MAG-120823-bin87]KRP01298.1 MAG: glutathione peroxidase [SAR86 cluster bacterium BACL1 MAG-120619-bin26]KRP17526.1 MAG: glutathione peroxidase [SAR86 cluster bacterium BACL1 MAG-121001-bin56]MDP5037508.1 glutathione peroxidase [SAR86 cluster bacterium]